jgi:hypothetical protein
MSTIAQRKEALRLRVRDIATGAGIYSESDGLQFDACQWPRFMGAIVNTFCDEVKRPGQYKTIVAYWNVDEFDSLQRATEFLWRQGVRA